MRSLFLTLDTVRCSIVWIKSIKVQTISFLGTREPIITGYSLSKLCISQAVCFTLNDDNEFTLITCGMLSLSISENLKLVKISLTSLRAKYFYLKNPLECFTVSLQQNTQRHYV